LGCIDFYDPAVAQHRDAIGIGAHDCEVVRDKDGRNVMLSGQIADPF
jgi:hypothetical protein